MAMGGGAAVTSGWLEGSRCGGCVDGGGTGGWSLGMESVAMEDLDQEYRMSVGHWGPSGPLEMVKLVELEGWLCGRSQELLSIV